jgi:hypothetical protein
LAFWVGNEQPEREFLTDISVSSGRYELGRKLRVGDRDECVIQNLGRDYTRVREPDVRSWMPQLDSRPDFTYRYTDDDGHLESHVYISVRAGQVTRIDWVFGVD